MRDHVNVIINDDKKDPLITNISRNASLADPDFFVVCQIRVYLTITHHKEIFENADYVIIADIATCATLENALSNVKSETLLTGDL